MSKNSSKLRSLSEISSEDLILKPSLQSFFYEQLQDINAKIVKPLPLDTIYYSSLVLDRFGLSHELFEVESGKYKNKVLGAKLLQANNLSGKIKQRALRDIGDTALFVCGYFAESMNRKLIDVRYYQDLGVIAYKRLNDIAPEHSFTTPSFYKSLSRTFTKVTTLLNILAQKNNDKQDNFESSLVILTNTKNSKVS